MTTNVYIASLTGKLGIQERYITYGTARDQNNYRRGCISSLVSYNNASKYILCASDAKLAMFATSVHRNSKSINTTVFISFSDNMSEDRASITALRTALLQTLMEDDVVVYTKPSVISHDVHDVILNQGDTLLGVLEDDSLSHVIDVVLECVDIVTAKTLLDKKVSIKVASDKNHIDELSRIEGDARTATSGHTDWVLHDNLIRGGYSSVDRLCGHAKQLGVSSELQQLLR